MNFINKKEMMNRLHEKTIYYFSQPGKENTQKTLELAVERALLLQLEAILVATKSGETPLRLAEVAAVRDTMRRYGCPSAVKRRIIGTMPTVEIVMALAAILRPTGSHMIAAASMTRS